jgi:hypothetical protein
VIIRVDIHDRLMLLTESPMTRRSDWEEIPKLPRAYEPVIGRSST